MSAPNRMAPLRIAPEDGVVGGPCRMAPLRIVPEEKVA